MLKRVLISLAVPSTKICRTPSRWRFQRSTILKLAQLSPTGMTLPKIRLVRMSATVNPDVTLFSRGLPVDVTHGRLKEDLTVYLETGNGLKDDDHIVRDRDEDADYRGPKFGAELQSNPDSDNLPRFGLLRSWHDLGKGIGEGNKMPNQPQTNTEHGFHPTVMRAGVSFTVVRIGPD